MGFICKQPGAITLTFSCRLPLPLRLSCVSGPSVQPREACGVSGWEAASPPTRARFSSCNRGRGRGGATIPAAYPCPTHCEDGGISPGAGRGSRCATGVGARRRCGFTWTRNRLKDLLADAQADASPPSSAHCLRVKDGFSFPLGTSHQAIALLEEASRMFFKQVAPYL